MDGIDRSIFAVMAVIPCPSYSNNYLAEVGNRSSGITFVISF